MFNSEDIHRHFLSHRANTRPHIASMYKIGFHKSRIDSYLNGDNIFPVTLELDLTSRCNRDCPDCPSTRVSHNHNLSIEFIDNLFSLLEGKTRGLLLTGGEPTLSPLFPRALQSARDHGFEEIAVVTNGSFLDSPPVEDSLLRLATTIRLSLYDWEKNVCGPFESTLRKIEKLRDRIDQSGSQLRIGISALTSENRAEKLEILTDMVQAAGAHWIYFHPLCTKWRIGKPTPEKQDGIIEKIRDIQSRTKTGAEIFFSRERYESFPLEFEKYHAAHFLLVVGADGKNYLGPEVKYHPGYEIANLLDGRPDEFLWRKSRTDMIARYTGKTYPAIKSRHRGILYNHFIDRLKHPDNPLPDGKENGASLVFYFPHIL